MDLQLAGKRVLVTGGSIDILINAGPRRLAGKILRGGVDVSHVNAAPTRPAPRTATASRAPSIPPPRACASRAFRPG